MRPRGRGADTASRIRVDSLPAQFVGDAALLRFFIDQSHGHLVPWFVVLAEPNEEAATCYVRTLVVDGSDDMAPPNARRIGRVVRVAPHEWFYRHRISGNLELLSTTLINREGKEAGLCADVPL